MILLAEISDKMPTVLERWLYMLLPSLLLVGICFWNRWLSAAACITFLLVGFILAKKSIRDSYNGDLADAIQSELGTFWIYGTASSWFLPAICLGTTAIIKFCEHRKQTTHRLRDSA